jgi:hypothetical protein
MFPHAEHFQFKDSALKSFSSGGLIAGSTAFTTGFLGTKVGHALGEDFGC